LSQRLSLAFVAAVRSKKPAKKYFGGKDVICASTLRLAFTMQVRVLPAAF